MSNGTVATNRRAGQDYFVEDAVEAGIVLQGSEVKSMRDHRASIQEAYAVVENGEVWLDNMHIAAYSASLTNPDPYRRRKLLLHKSEIRRLTRAVQQKGYTCVALALYWKGHRVKCEIALAKGKADHDKRETIKERDWQRQKQRLLRHT